MIPGKNMKFFCMNSFQGFKFQLLYIFHNIDFKLIKWGVIFLYMVEVIIVAKV